MISRSPIGHCIRQAHYIPSEPVAVWMWLYVGVGKRLVDAVYVASGPSSQCLESDCGGCQPLTHCRPCLGYEKVGGS